MDVSETIIKDEPFTVKFYGDDINNINDTIITVKHKADDDREETET